MSKKRAEGTAGAPEIDAATIAGTLPRDRGVGVSPRETGGLWKG